MRKVSSSAFRLYHRRMLALTKTRTNCMRNPDKNGQILWGAHELFWGIKEICHVPNKMSTILFARNGKFNSPSQLGHDFQQALFASKATNCPILPRRELRKSERTNRSLKTYRVFRP